MCLEGFRLFAEKAITATLPSASLSRLMRLYENSILRLISGVRDHFRPWRTSGKSLGKGSAPGASTDPDPEAPAGNQASTGF